MISFKEYIGKIPIDQIPIEHINNIEKLLKKLNLFRSHFGKPMFVSSGYRTKSEHERIYREINAKRLKEKKKPLPVPARSCHLRGQAADFYDPDGELMKFCKDNEQLLVEIGLWVEAETIGWLHLQCVPFASYVAGGTIFFKA